MVRNKSLELGMKGTLFYLFVDRCSKLVQKELRKLGMDERSIVVVEALVFGTLLVYLVNRDVKLF